MSAFYAKEITGDAGSVLEQCDVFSTGPFIPPFNVLRSPVLAFPGSQLRLPFEPFCKEVIAETPPLFFQELFPRDQVN